MVLLECKQGKARWFTDLDTGAEFHVIVVCPETEATFYYVAREDANSNSRLSYNYPTRKAADAYLFSIARALAARVTVIFLEEVAEFEEAAQ